MAGSCDAVVRVAGSSKCVNIPYRYWGLEIGTIYRVVITRKSVADSCPPYSYDAKLTKSGESARLIVPSCLTQIKPFERVHVWVGHPNEYGQPGEMCGRGYCQKERAKYLEEQTDILRRCAGE